MTNHSVAGGFIADVHLGRLARMLRMLGIDTAYQASATRTELLHKAHLEKRILLTRDRQLQHNPFIQVLLVASEVPTEQLQQVLQHFSLVHQLRPLSRCLLCNTPLQEVPKAAILHLVPEGTRQYFDQFWTCSNCQKVYWKGSHYDRMMQVVERVKGQNDDQL